MVFLAKFLRVFAIIVILMLITLPFYGFSCPVCYGAPDSPLTAGMNMAIFTLLGIIGTVLGMFVMFFFYLIKRARNSSIQ